MQGFQGGGLYTVTQPGGIQGAVLIASHADALRPSHAFLLHKRS